MNSFSWPSILEDFINEYKFISVSDYLFLTVATSGGATSGGVISGGVISGTVISRTVISGTVINRIIWERSLAILIPRST